ncbi:MAG: PKD domain-containing protein [Candidatus Thermoplasmatota archaeon]|nr:PKD domain-containing protein [Candidatus Thermoplasmatota archaeon]
MTQRFRNILAVTLTAFLLSPLVVISTEACNPDVNLPDNIQIPMVAEHAQTTWFTMQLSDVPSGYDITNGYYSGWCLQRLTTMSNATHQVYLISSYNTSMPAAYQNNNWSKINYILNHKSTYSRQSIQNAIWYFADHYPYPTNDTNATALIAAANESGESFCPDASEILAILVDVYQPPGTKGNDTNTQRACLELVIPQQSSNGGTTPPPTNYPPTADAWTGTPYKAAVNEPIIFDGSASYDRDGTIVTYHWDFGDYTFGDQQIMEHVYTVAGVYTVSLTVTDDDGATDTYTTTATVHEPNTAPSAPDLTGTPAGTTQTDYTYTAVSTDPENDTIRYIFTWNDGTPDTVTAFADSGVVVNTTHNWSTAGVYHVSVYAEDSNHAESDPTHLFVLINVSVEFIAGQLSGYLIDYQQNGTYLEFYNNETGQKTTVERQPDGTYLIDSDGDGDWDYQYNVTTGVLTSLAADVPVPEENTPGFEFLLVVAAVLLLGLLRRKNKHH